MNIFFPQLQCALVVRKKAPKGSRFVASFDAEKSVYLVDATIPPRGAQIAEKFLGGWNFADGTCVHLVYGSSLADLSRYRREQAGDWIVFPRQFPDGRWCGLLKTCTSIDFAIGCTPIVL